jgi:methyl-accepting chemotaxis protein
MNNSIYSGKPLKIFIVLITLLSIFGGYQLSQLIYRMNSDYMQRTEKILAMERSLDDTNVALSRQIQEWKDMLLRANDTELYNKHRQAFFDASLTSQGAFQRAKSAIRDAGMDTTFIEHMIDDNEALLSDYLAAKSILKQQQIDSFREVDKQIIGADRHLQNDFAALETEIRDFSNQQLNEIMPAQRNRYLLGLLGAISLLVMALLGFVFASLFQDPDKKAAANPSAI